MDKNNKKRIVPKKHRYKSVYTGNVYDTKKEAEEDNARYLQDVEYRYQVKSNNVKRPVKYNIPFIKEKKITLSNACLIGSPAAVECLKKPELGNI